MNSVKELAQWVIDNRYPKNENEKVSDFEMYNFIVDSVKALNYNQRQVSNVLNCETCFFRGHSEFEEPCRTCPNIRFK